MTTASRVCTRTGVIAAAAITTLITTGALAAPASAHVPGWSVTCGQVSLRLRAYDAHSGNTVTLQAAGMTLLPRQTFGSSFDKTLQLPPHSSPLQVHLIVHAGDDQRFDVDQTKTAPVCASQSPAPTASNSAPSPSATASTSAAAPAPYPSTSNPDSNLAETGGSSSTAVVASIGAAVLAGGGVLLAGGRMRRGRGIHSAR